MSFATVAAGRENGHAFRTSRIARRLVFALSMLCVRNAFGQDVPSEAEGRLVFERDHRFDYLGRTKLSAFTKTDGQRREQSGVALYLMFFEATLECTDPKGCCVHYSVDEWRGSINCRESVALGGRYMQSGKILFERTERGWNGKFTGSQKSTKMSERTGQTLEVASTPAAQ